MRLLFFITRRLLQDLPPLFSHPILPLDLPIKLFFPPLLSPELLILTSLNAQFELELVFLFAGQATLVIVFDAVFVGFLVCLDLVFAGSLLPDVGSDDLFVAATVSAMGSEYDHAQTYHE